MNLEYIFTHQMVADPFTKHIVQMCIALMLVIGLHS